MYGCTGSSLLHMGFLYLPVVATLCRHVRTTHSHCGAFSCCGAWVPEHAGSVVVMHKLSCSEARGISPDQGLNPCLLYWRAGEPLDHQGSPHTTGIIHSSADGHLGCFHVLAIVNSAAMNIGVRVSFWISVLSGYMPRSGIAGLYSDSIFSVLKELPYSPHQFTFPSTV